MARTAQPSAERPVDYSGAGNPYVEQKGALGEGPGQEAERLTVDLDPDSFADGVDLADNAHLLQQLDDHREATGDWHKL